jgi:hypothetical protein
VVDVATVEVVVTVVVFATVVVVVAADAAVVVVIGALLVVVVATDADAPIDASGTVPASAAEHAAAITRRRRRATAGWQFDGRATGAVYHARRRLASRHRRVQACSDRAGDRGGIAAEP